MSPAEGFLFSRVDSASNERDLALMTGMPEDAVTRALDRLFQLGAIDFGDGTRPPARPAAAAQGAAPAEKPKISSLFDGGAVGTYDPAELREEVELDDEKKKRILDAFYRLDALNHYEILGLDQSADRKAIKAAYYQLAPEFHPDKFFRKNLGAFRPKIEALFSRITLAHDTLAAKDKRVEYDEYLSQALMNAKMSAALEQGMRDLEHVQSAVDRAARAEAGVSVPPPAVSITPVPRMPESAESIQARRETLARKLQGGAMRRNSSMPAPGSVPPANHPEAIKAAGEALKARYEHALAEAKRVQLNRYLDLGARALEARDYATAANAYQIAASLSPDDPIVKKRAEEAQREAYVALADGYAKQAAFEVSLERWAEAIVSYSKVVKGRPDDARAHERLAHSILKDGGAARKAVEHARKSVEISPKNPEFRVALARAYSCAGLEKSADGELQRARELAPNDAKIRDLIAQSKDFVKEYLTRLAKQSQQQQKKERPV